MKIRILDRILVALAGLILIAACAALVAQVVFQADVTGFAARVIANASFGRKAALLLIALGLLLLGCYCFMLMFRHKTRKDRFVFQENENGELAISMKVLDQLVRKCLAEHPEMDLQALELDQKRDGLRIRISGSAAGGISIPLTVEALQKQIKQYVTACSGVEISSVEVDIETTGADAPGAAFLIPAPGSGRLPRETETAAEDAAPAKTETQGRSPEAPADTDADPEAKEEPSAPAEPERSAPESILTTGPVSAAAPEEEITEEDDRPMHQRLFSAQMEPCIIPEPPAETEELPEADESLPGEPAEEEIPAETPGMESETDREEETAHEAAPDDENHQTLTADESTETSRTDSDTGETGRLDAAFFAAAGAGEEPGPEEPAEENENRILEKDPAEAENNESV